VEELATIRDEALGVHRRCRPVVDLLYSTGARLQEACGITLEDVIDTHIVLRDTKRRPGGLQVHRTARSGRSVGQPSSSSVNFLPGSGIPSSSRANIACKTGCEN
jgi:integrase